LQRRSVGLQGDQRALYYQHFFRAAESMTSWRRPCGSSDTEQVQPKFCDANFTALAAPGRRPAWLLTLRPPPPCCRPCRGAAGIPRRLAACSQWRQLRLVPAAGSSGCGQTLAHWRVQSAARSHSRGRVSRGLAGAAGAWAMPVRWWAVPPGGRATPAARRPCVSSRRHLHCPSAGEASGSQSLPLWQQAVGAKGATPGSSTSLLCVCRGRVPPRPPGVLPDHPRHAPPVLGALSIRPGPGA